MAVARKAGEATERCQKEDDRAREMTVLARVHEHQYPFPSFDLYEDA
jgi:hypothetical protein